MRPWLDAPERPSPPPLVTDDRKPIYVGLALWIIALVVGLTSTAAWAADLLWTCAVGIVLGLIGFIYAQFRRR